MDGANGGAGMQGFKSAFDMFRAFMPVVYCAGLLGYFFYVGGSVQGVEMLGLGPTLLGLALVGVIFCIPLALKLMRLFGGGPRAPGSGGRPDVPDKDGFDPDAAIARYMASQRSAEPVPTRPAPSPAYSARPTPKGGPAKPSGFGRRIG
jgi:hypothetical protein